jgi:hypothetical protein
MLASSSMQRKLDALPARTRRHLLHTPPPPPPQSVTPPPAMHDSANATAMHLAPTADTTAKLSKVGVAVASGRMEEAERAAVAGVAGTGVLMRAEHLPCTHAGEYNERPLQQALLACEEQTRKLAREIIEDAGVGLLLLTSGAGPSFFPRTRCS